MCLLKCVGALSDSIPASGLFVARRTFISPSQLCKSYSGASRPSSVFSALLSAPFARSSFTYRLSLSIYPDFFFDDSLSQEILGPATRFIALDQSSMLRLSQARNAEPCPIMRKLIFHVEIVISITRTLIFKDNRLSLRMLNVILHIYVYKNYIICDIFYNQYISPYCM